MSKSLTERLSARYVQNWWKSNGYRWERIGRNGKKLVYYVENPGMHRIRYEIEPGLRVLKVMRDFDKEYELQAAVMAISEKSREQQEPDLYRGFERDG